MSVWIITGRTGDEYEPHTWVVGYVETKDSADAVIAVLQREIKLARTILGPLKRTERMAWKKYRDHEKHKETYLAIDILADNVLWRKFHDSASIAKHCRDWSEAHGAFWNKADELSTRVMGTGYRHMFSHMYRIEFTAREIPQLGLDSLFIATYAPDVQTLRE